MSLDIASPSSLEIFRLFGKLYESDAVAEFLASRPPHRLTKPSDGHQFVICKKGGFDFLFENIGPGGIGRKQTRLLKTVFIFNDKAEGHNRYPDLLPFGFTFSDTRETLLERRVPVRTYRREEGVVELDFPDPHHDLWRAGDYLVAVFYVDQRIHRLQISLLPEHEPLPEPIVRITWRRLARDPATKLQAIQLYHREHNVSLAEAKTIVEAFAAAHGRR
jgi:hypothetical protein